MLRVLLRDRRGTTSIEYALIAVGIGMAIFLAILALGVDVTAYFTSASTKLGVYNPQ
jgi:Flp pilus assembly pilin Flp